MKQAKFISIKTYAQMPQEGMAAEMPPEYPAECREFATLEEAQAECPGQNVMSIEAYAGYKAAMDLVFAAKVAELKERYADGTPAPWWKFW